MSNIIGLSGGIAIGNAFLLEEKKIPEKKKVQDVDAETIRLKKGIQMALDNLTRLIEAEDNPSSVKKDILETHKLLLEDPMYYEKASLIIEEAHLEAEYAAYTAARELAQIFENMDNAYFKERAADMMDIGWNVLDALSGKGEADLSLMSNAIIIAEDLTPADTVKLDLDSVAGFITEVGGPTSHTAIIARSMAIPAVKSVGITKSINNNDLIVLDGDKGVIHINPTTEEVEVFKKEIEKQTLEKEALRAFIDVQPTTMDGHKVSVVANIVAPNVVEQVNANGGMGVGLYRSEFLYMESSVAPDEEIQYAAYKRVAEAFDGKEVVVRTLDVGGDKAIDYLGIKAEENPFLGNRAIRYCLKNIPLFKVQIRALLRASHHGSISIMLPMIGTIEELRNAKSIIETCKVELDNEGVSYDKAIKVGIMIEVPSAAIMSDVLAREADFFSIGTNDLIGYTMAADRMNQSVAYLYKECQSAVLRLIQMTIDNGHKAGIKVSMCGNSASNPRLIPVYLGMGLDKFSVNPSEILKVKKHIDESNYSDCKRLTEKVLSAGTVEDVMVVVD